MGSVVPTVLTITFFSCSGNALLRNVRILHAARNDARSLPVLDERIIQMHLSVPGRSIFDQPINHMARLAGFEPTTSAFAGLRSIQLSYKRTFDSKVDWIYMVPRARVELARPCGHYALNVARLPFRHLGIRVCNSAFSGFIAISIQLFEVLISGFPH